MIWLLSFVLRVPAFWTLSKAWLEVSMAVLVAAATTDMGSGTLAREGEKLTMATTSREATVSRRTMIKCKLVCFCVAVGLDEWILTRSIS